MGQAHQSRVVLKGVIAVLIPIGIAIMRGSVVTTAIYAFVMLVTSPTYAQPPHRCSDAATAQAHKLLAFHVGPDSRIEIGKPVKALAAIRNPANTKQSLDVLEVWGYVYKAQYRMRFIYARIPNECVLMGQEILEHSSM
jgi:hypothetical protein